MVVFKKISGIIDTINHWVGTVCSYAVLPLMIVITIEVITRKAGHPTIWGYETIVFIYGFLIMMVAGFGLLKDVLVKVDLLSSRLNEYNQRILSLITYLVFFLPFMTLVIPECWASFYKDFVGQTVSMTAWAPILWPIKLVLPVSIVLLWLQGISEIIKTVIYLIENKNNPAVKGKAKGGEA